ncbi:MAG TPA: hypothetical protein VHN14_22205, partial [Kofleriaceae bacterium]|nr:hypothetical protein [Kofleriaceae bacterium]
IEISGGVMQRAERIVLVAGGTLIAAWYGSDVDTASLDEPIIGVTMLICGGASTVTAVNRWIVAYRELTRRAEARAKSDVLAPASAPSNVSAAARVLLPSPVRKVAPIEQH